MKLSDLANLIGASVCTNGLGDSEICHVYAGDRISDLLNHADGHSLLVSNLEAAQLLKLTHLLDCPAFCLLNGRAPDAEAIELANSHGTAIIVSPLGMYETCGLVFESFKASGGKQ